MTSGERLKAKDCLKFHQMLSPGLSSLAVLSPAFHRNLELTGDQMKQRGQRKLLHAEHDTGIAEVAKLHSKSQPVRRAAALPDDGNSRFTEGIAPNQVVSVTGRASRLARSEAERMERRGTPVLSQATVYENRSRRLTELLNC